jgi:methionyl aminopeptidase
MAIFEAGLDAIAPMQSINFFGVMIEESAKLGEYGIIREYCGHGIGRSIHMNPQVLNYNDGGRTRDVFEVGQSYAVEPVLAIELHYQLEQHNNGWTVSAGCLTSHNEDTIFIGQHSVINLTGDDHE